MNDFDLSEKIRNSPWSKLGSIKAEDVNEFIKILKYKMSFSEDSKFFNHWCDKLAGERLSSPNPTKTTEEKE